MKRIGPTFTKKLVDSFPLLANLALEASLSFKVPSKNLLLATDPLNPPVIFGAFYEGLSPWHPANNASLLPDNWVSELPKAPTYCEISTAFSEPAEAPEAAAAVAA
jgi:hypothetical protein